MKYRFEVDGYPAGPIRKKWESAAWDAVNAGWAVWTNDSTLKMNTNMGGAINRIEENDD